MISLLLPLCPVRKWYRAAMPLFGQAFLSGRAVHSGFFLGGGNYVCFKHSDPRDADRPDGSGVLGDDRRADPQHYGVVRSGRRADASLRRDHCLSVCSSGQAPPSGISPQIPVLRHSTGQCLFHLLLSVHVSVRRRAADGGSGHDQLHMALPCGAVCHSVQRAEGQMVDCARRPCQLRGDHAGAGGRRGH